jgi:WD40 repeat protein/serine/threonine protein kinase
MPSSDSSRDALLERLAEEFIERHRRGERPALSEYADRHPELAAEIRNLFPALVQIEHLKPVAGDLTGAFVPESGQSDDHTPERLGEYRILRQVGSGGMGVVYEAEQESLGRHVALKILPRQALLKATYLERFRREAKAAAKLHHTNIVPVFGVGECDGTHYYAMQFIRGEGLDKVLRDLRRLRTGPGAPATVAEHTEASVAHSLLTGRFDVPADPPDPATPAADRVHGSSTLSAAGPEGHYFRGIARLGVQVADALAYAHRQGILHRDIKPSNLLLDQQGTVWITDFGLAKAEGSDDLTQTGDIVGTVRYMAPERFDGRSLVQSDVYALGLTLYELLTLRPAFDDTNKAKLVNKVLHEPPTSPRKLDPRIPRDLETVVLKCLAKDPRERYPSAHDLLEDLQRFLADRPVKARRATLIEKAIRWRRRNPVATALLSLVGIVLVLGTAFSTYFGLRAMKEKDRADAAAAEAIADRNQAQQSALEARRNLYVARMNLADTAARDGHTSKVLQLLHNYDSPTEPGEDLRGWEWHYLHRSCSEQVRTWSNILAVAVHPINPRWIALVRLDSPGTVRLWDLVNEQDVRTYGFDLAGAKVWGLAFSPSGNELACRLLTEKGWVVKRWNSANGHQLLDITGTNRGNSHLWSIAYSPDGQMVVTHENDRVQVWDAVTGTVQYPIAGRFPTGDLGPLFSPDGQWLITAERPVVKVRQASDGREVFSLATGPDTTILAISADGRLLATAALDDAIQIWDLSTRRQQRTLQGSGGILRVVAFSPNGGIVAGAGDDTNVHIWDLAAGTHRVLHGHTSGVNYLEFSPDGRRLLTHAHDDTVHLWDVVSETTFRRLRASWSGSEEFHPDGRHVTIAVEESENRWTVRTIDMRSGRQAGKPESCSATWVLVRYSPDGECHFILCRDNVVYLRDPATGEERALCRGMDLAVHTVALSPDGRWLAVGLSKEGDPQLGLDDRRELRLVDTTNGAERVLMREQQEPFRVLVFSPDGKTLIGTDWLGSRARSWDVSSGQEGNGFEAHDTEVESLAFSRRGDLLAIGSRDRTIRVWEVSTWRLLTTLHGHTDSVCSVAFSPDGLRLASGAYGGSVKLWDLGSGQELLTLPARTPFAPIGVSFSSDGHWLLTDGYEGVALWDARPLTPEVREEREAVSALLGYLDRPLLKEEAAVCLREDPTLRESIRSKALGLLEELTDDPDPFNRASWAVVRESKAAPEDCRLALRQAEIAHRLAPTNPKYLNTLGVAQYRMGHYQEAVTTLDKSLAAGKGQSDAFDLYFLAMCHAKLGDPTKAKDYFDRAVKWTEAQKFLEDRQVEELKAFRAEAETVLGSEKGSGQKRGQVRFHGPDENLT